MYVMVFSRKNLSLGQQTQQMPIRLHQRLPMLPMIKIIKKNVGCSGLQLSSIHARRKGRRCEGARAEQVIYKKRFSARDSSLKLCRQGDKE
mmetsp:Transcript_20912/g.29223  ORF Transcript_20912/g.29223 Transcript_20912/m.29223 type:complete len:91 (-) Transcript_20912:17-289(-)